MSDRDAKQPPEDFSVEGLDPDDTAQQLHPSAPVAAPHDDADDDFAEEPDFEVNDG